MQPLTHRCAKLTWQTNLVSQFRFWIENPSEFTSFSILIIKLKSTSKVTQLAYHQPAAELPDTCPASMMMFNWQVPGVAPTASEVLFTFPRSYIDLFKKMGLLMGGGELSWTQLGGRGFTRGQEETELCNEPNSLFLESLFLVIIIWTCKQTPR